MKITPAPVRATKRLLRPGLIVALSAVLGVLCCGGAVSVLLFGDLTNNQSNLLNSMSCGGTDTISVNGEFSRIGPYGPDQIRNAAIIIRAGQDLGVPPRGWVIA